MLRRQNHVLSQSTTPCACTLLLAFYPVPNLGLVFQFFWGPKETINISGCVRQQQGTEICNFGVPSPLDFFEFSPVDFPPFLQVFCVKHFPNISGDFLEFRAETRGEFYLRVAIGVAGQGVGSGSGGWWGVVSGDEKTNEHEQSRDCAGNGWGSNLFMCLVAH